MNVLLNDMFPDFYGLSKECNENHNISRDRNACHHAKPHQGCSVTSVRI